MPTPLPRSQTSVLIVDDDAFMCELIHETLATLGVRTVHHARNGLSAMRWLQAADVVPDLVISDIYMPDMDGFEFINALAEMRYPGKILLCSGVNTESLALARDVAEGMGLTLAGVHPKPLSAEVLDQVLQQNGL